MKVEIRINGSFHLELTPETPAETVVLNEMLDRAKNGQPISMGDRGDGRWPADVSIEA
jgi:hypothetical protein